MGLSSAIDVSAVARVVGIKTEFKDLRGGGVLNLPQRIIVIGQGDTTKVYDTTKLQVTSAQVAATVYGFGSPIHLACQQLFPTNGDGVGTIPVTVYPLDEDEASVGSEGLIIPTVFSTEAAAYTVRVNEIESETFVVTTTDTDQTVSIKIALAINSVLEMPIVALHDSDTIIINSKWKGESANDIFIEIIGPTNVGNSFAISQPSGGLINPDVDDALNQVGNIWETLVLSCLNISDVTTLSKYDTFGEGRWDALTRKPCLVFTGNTATSVAEATVESSVRKTDRTNVQLVAPGSNNLPFVVAARQLVRIAKVANNNPPQDYGSQPAQGLVPGIDSDQWTYPDRDQAVKAGSSTIEVKDGVINLSDTVTFYHPIGDPIPAYRFVNDIIKVMNISFNLDLIFATKEWDGAPLIPNNQPTTNRAAKKPKTAVAAVSKLIDSLGLNAIISDPEIAKQNTFAEIDSQNPKRLNVLTTMQISGNSNIISVDFQFGFFFGTQAIVA